MLIKTQKLKKIKIDNHGHNILFNGWASEPWLNETWFSVINWYIQIASQAAKPIKI